MPEHVEPGGRLRTCAEQPARREKAREREHVEARHHRAEEVRAREREQSARANDGELLEQQHRGNQVAHHQRRLVRRDERRQRRKRLLRERHEAGEHDRRHADDGERHLVVPASGRVRREKCARRPVQAPMAPGKQWKN